MDVPLHVLYKVVHTHSQLLTFIPPYSLDYNPIEESSSYGECLFHISLSVIFIYGLEL
jgi:hypothetical protein